MRHRNQIGLLLSLLAVAGRAGCSSGNGTVTVRIVSTSDIHGRILDTDHLTGQEREGSLAKFSTFLGQQRKEFRNVIYLGIS